MNVIKNAYGTLYLSEERAKKYMEIVNQYIVEMGAELKAHGFCPSVLAIGKTSVYELDAVNQGD